MAPSAATAAMEVTLAREVRPLLAIDDHHPKLVLTSDSLAPALPSGLIHQDLRDFLAGTPLRPRWRAPARGNDSVPGDPGTIRLR